MTQVNVDPDDGGTRRSSDAATEATKNLTWAIAAVIVIVSLIAIGQQVRKRRRRASAQQHRRKASILHARGEQQRAEADEVEARARELDPDQD